MDSTLILVVGLAAVYAGLAGVVIIWMKSGRTVTKDRRRPKSASHDESALSALAVRAVETVNKQLHGRQLKLLAVDKFEQAGVSLRAADFILICVCGAFGVAILGTLLANLGLGVLLALLFVVGMLVWLNLKASKRQGKFAEQLPDTLQLLTGSLRAGHSLLRAVDTAADQSSQPMSDELRRVVNENRIGRDLGESMAETAARTKSQDFLWTAQAIETQREVGGNLAEVLDNVNNTIRERAYLARQVRALTAEGRLSAIVLVGLPIALLIFISVINPTYANVFYTTLPGWIMLGVVAVMLTIGTIWMLRLTKPKY
ncbi:type II secretion system F family protein [Sinomonas mesophila]|uniref:type II secretion system F family protein n=1 Tax=Sinomonas mesophila TaxID=1531955 RepID=UPI0009842906|nr:type II secretion system F family protein [Sinomonas mesophila]